MGKAGTGQALTFVDGGWQSGRPLVLSAASQAVWLASVVFDGARALAGTCPDLDLHCARLVESAKLLGLAPTLDAGTIEQLAWEGIGRFAGDAALYICPIFCADQGFVVPDPDSTRFILSIYESPLPEATGFAACLSSFRRPARDMAPTEAKAACLYPNVARAVSEARARGFDTAVMRDPNGNVAEFAFTNLFLVKDGIAHTPAANGTFLNGITRQRVAGLLRGAGIEVVERSIDVAELDEADELFATGNYAKVQPCTRYEQRTYPIGPVYRTARELYFEFARTSVRPTEVA